MVWELGLKGDFGPADFSFALFRQEISGFQSNIFTGTGFALANAGKQSTWGVEFDGSVRPTKGLNLNLARYAYRLGSLRAGAVLSPVEIAPQWHGPEPAPASVEIASARGVDLNPLAALLTGALRRG